jgi:hypothetical protein
MCGLFTSRYLSSRLTFVFQILHLFPHPMSGTFEVASNVMLIIGTVALILATWTGWVTWKRRYGGARATLFQRKIAISFAMSSISVLLTIWRTAFLPAFEDVPSGIAHWLYLAGTLLLMVGAALEGFYGGRLNHK